MILENRRFYQGYRFLPEISPSLISHICKLLFTVYLVNLLKNLKYLHSSSVSKIFGSDYLFKGTVCRFLYGVSGREVEGVGGNAVAQAEFFNILQCQEIFYEVHFCPDEKYFFPGPRAIQNITFFIITQFHDFFASLLYTK